MASSTLAPTLSLSTKSYSYLPNTKHRFSCPRIKLFYSKHRSFSVSASASASTSNSLQALIFDCDGVILESEHLHRQAYNDAFVHFNVRCPSSSSPGPLNWDVQFYDELQNLIGGGKPKMRWYFKEHGWPKSTLFETPPTNDVDRAKLIDTLQDWKTERYKEIIKSGTVKPRPGVLRLMDEARDAGKKLAVCSAATKSSVILCLENLIGIERFQGLDCFLAGDDVKEKKPSPSIYVTASKKLGISEKDCLVVEDSVIGLQAATQAGMSCVVTYTPSTAEQDFKEAIAIYPDLSNVRYKALLTTEAASFWPHFRFSLSPLKTLSFSRSPPNQSQKNDDLKPVHRWIVVKFEYHVRNTIPSILTVGNFDIMSELREKPFAL
ncbi:Haloacid dehalogenase-like hydrolase domain-containing protein isoform B [Glycine soja]|uniref:Haloacid dehalogenase-like hydrolase domain-containing protein isoform B n=1 Tax=Glycine soja TaxID=3848 RepID=A0A445KQE4_GLYSO|nr:Haloacid dehalogenase-like hydrolase domain-containing protein isoform B [Glycine soja]